MEIKTATANLKGGYDLTFKKGNPATVTTRDRTPESLALIAWMREGNVPDPWTPSLDEAKLVASDGVERQFSELLVSLTGGASIEERDTWSIKEAAARAILDGNPVDSQVSMITAEAQAVGESANDLAVRVIQKAEKFYALVGVSSGMKRAAHSAIQGAQSLPELDAVIAALAEQRDVALASLSA